MEPVPPRKGNYWWQHETARIYSSHLDDDRWYPSGTFLEERVARARLPSGLRWPHGLALRLTLHLHG